MLFERTSGRKSARNRYTSTRRLMTEHLEDRRLLALVGVDFSQNTQPPSNWTHWNPNVPQDSLDNLRDETGSRTSFDLRIAGSRLATSNVKITSPTLPTHTNPLQNLDGTIKSTASATFTFSDLDPAKTYDVYVFGLGTTLGSPERVQDENYLITVSGAGTPATFSQSLVVPGADYAPSPYFGPRPGDLYINGSKGTNADLADFKVQQTPDTSGNLVITADPPPCSIIVCKRWSIAGIAIEEVSAPPNTAPTVTADNAIVSVNEGSTATNTGTFNDVDGDDVTVTANPGTIDSQDTGPTGNWTWSQLVDDGPLSQTVTVTATDANSASSDTTFDLVVNNVAPTGALIVSEIVPVGTAAVVQFVDQFDPSSADTIAGFHYAYDFDNDGTFDQGDGTYAGSPASDMTEVPPVYLSTPLDSLTIAARIIDKDDGFSDYTGTILTGIKDPGTPYVDANNDGLYHPASGDVLLDDGELDDGFFDTAIPEGPDYTIPIAGAGLRIHGTPISSFSLDFLADGGITVNTDLTATNKNLLLTSRTDSVELDDPTLHARDLLEITAAVDIISSDDQLRASGSESAIRLDAGDDIILIGTKVTAMREVEMDAGDELIINPSVSNPATVTATPNLFGKVDLDAVEINLSGTEIDANRNVIIHAAGAVNGSGTKLTANAYAPGTVSIHATAFISFFGGYISARDQIVIESATDSVGLVNATVQTAAAGSSSIHIDAATVVAVSGGTLSAAAAIDVNAGGDLYAVASNWTAAAYYAASVTLTALGDIDLDLTRIAANKDIDVDSAKRISADSVVLTANGHSQARIRMNADEYIAAPHSNLFARQAIELLADQDDVDVNSATVQTSTVGNSSIVATAGDGVLAMDATLRAGGKVTLSGVLRVIAPDAVLTATPYYLGKVHLQSLTGPVEVPAATITATKDVEIDAGGDLLGDNSVIRADGHSDGTIDVDSGSDLFLDGAQLKARERVDLKAVDSIFAEGSCLLAQGDVLSQVRALAGIDLLLADSVIRARNEIELLAGGVADLTRASIGITHWGAGDLNVCASTIIVTDAVLKAPDDLLLCVLPIGIPTDISVGVLAPVSC